MEKTYKNNAITRDGKNSQIPKKITKTDVFEIYVIWKTIPPSWHDWTRDQLVKKGISDEHVIKLAGIKSQGEFSKVYKINKDQLSRWNQTERMLDSMSRIREFYRSYAPAVMGNLYDIVTSRDASPGHFKQFSNDVLNIGEKHEHGVSSDLKEIIEKLDKIL